MPKSVALVGGIQPYVEDNDTEVWCINASFANQKNHRLDRIYAFDTMRAFPEDILFEMNKTDESVRIITRKHWDEIPRSEEFPYDKVKTFFSGMEYYSCTASYMLAHAIYEGYDTIILCGMYWTHDSVEYFLNKPCMEFWMGIVVGMGRTLKTIGDCQLIKPWPWASKRYGYMLQANEALCVQTMAAAYRCSLEYPVKWLPAEMVDDGSSEGPLAKKWTNPMILGVRPAPIRVEEPGEGQEKEEPKAEKKKEEPEHVVK